MSINDFLAHFTLLGCKGVKKYIKYMFLGRNCLAEGGIFEFFGNNNNRRIKLGDKLKGGMTMR